MKRLNLSDEEAAHILRLRAKNAGVRGFNEGIDAALAQIVVRRQNLASKEPEEEVADGYLSELQVALGTMKKPELLS